MATSVPLAVKGPLAVGGVLAAAAAFLIVRGSRRKPPQVSQANSALAFA
jgi:hypothetical protein